MGSLDLDTRLAGGDGVYTATLSPDWRIWGPNGGYLAAIALRAAGLESRFRRPASFSCHFLGVADFAPIEVRVAKQRIARTADSLRVTLAQGGRDFLAAQVWTVDALPGMEHDFAHPPDVPGPGALPSFEELEGPNRGYAFWNNLDGRPTKWVPEAQWQPGEPAGRTWYRFRPEARFTDPFVDAARALLLVDTLAWPAACQAHRDEENPWIAPSLDVSVCFHRPAPESEWLLLDARSDVAAEGLIGFHNQVWSEDRRLVASGVGMLLCRPRTGGGIGSR